MSVDRSLSLYEIGVEGMWITDLLTENEGELTPELETRINELLTEGPQRLEAAAMVVRGMEASAEACENEVKRLALRAKSFQDQQLLGSS